MGEISQNIISVKRYSIAACIAGIVCHINIRSITADYFLGYRTWYLIPEIIKRLLLQTPALYS